MSDEKNTALRERATEILRQNERVGIRAPDFGADKEWLNVARPLSLSRDLAGKLVLLDFWTYCCINCMHVLPDLEYLEQKYADRPFVVVGCHTAKFANETELANVRAAVLRERIAHPIVVDREFDIWTRFAVRAWPTLVLISPDGRILGQVSGEGQRAVLDVLVEQALELYEKRPGSLDPRPLPMRLESSREFARELCFPGKVLADAASERLFIADSGHHRIVVTDFDGRVQRVIGCGEPGLIDGEAHEARFFGPQGLTLHQGALIVADTLNHALRRVDLASGAVETLVGNARQGYARDRALPLQGTSLNSPWDVRSDGERIFVAMAGSHQIWVCDLDTDSIAPLAGDGSEAKSDGAFELAAFAQPSGLALHRGQLYVADSESSSVRALDLEARRVTTLAGGTREPRNLFHFGDEDGDGFGRRFQHPLGIEIDAIAAPERALLYVADSYNHKLKIVDPDSGSVASYAGDGVPGCIDGPAERARFHEPQGLSIAGSKLFVADTLNHAIRVIDLEQHVVETLALRDLPIPSVALREMALDAAPLPRLPATLVHPQIKRRVPNGAATLEIRIELAPNEQLAPHAPSQFRVLREGGLVAAKKVTGLVTTTPLEIELGVAGPGLLRVQLLVYTCDAAGTCRLRSYEWPIDVEENERATNRIVLDAPAR